MKTLFRNLFLVLFLISAGSITGCTGKANPAADPTEKISATVIDPEFHDGDIIFQTSKSGQSYAIQLATHSIYSHCGLLFKDDGKWYVYEAIQPVVKTPLNEWIARGDSGIYVVKRLKDADSLMTKNTLAKLRKSVSGNMGKDYDIWFGWSDERIYCSELVWKAYHAATGLEVGKLKKLGDYDLTHPIVQKTMKKRYGKNIPLEEPMISPGAIFDSELLVTVKE
jgi:hypothetical protein